MGLFGSGSGAFDILDAPTQVWADEAGMGSEAGEIGDPLDIFGERSSAAYNKAAQQQIEQFYAALNLVKDQYQSARKMNKPYRKAGKLGLKYLTQSSGIEGLDNTLAEIMGTGAFSDLRDERTDSIEGMLSAGGLMRSGEAIEEGAAIPTDLALMLHQILSGDASNLAGMGQNAANMTGTHGMNYGSTAADLTSLVGNARADATLGAYSTRQNNIGTAGGILAKIFGGVGG